MRRLWLEKQAEAGDQAAQAALRGIRYRERRRQREDGIAGEKGSPQRPFTVGGLRAEVDEVRSIIIYRRVDGSEVFRDVGPRIVMRDKSNDSLEAALRVAAQKYGGRVRLTGSESEGAQLEWRLDSVSLSRAQICRPLSVGTSGGASIAGTNRPQPQHSRRPIQVTDGPIGHGVWSADCTGQWSV